MANFNLDVTLRKILGEFQNLKPADMAWKAGASFENNKFHLVFLNDTIEVSYPEGVVIYQETGRETGLIERILILHYLVHATGNPLTQKKISFKELPGGSIYIEPFTNRCIRSLLFHFGKNLEEFSTVAVRCNATKQQLGDVSYCFNTLPRVPVTLVLWAEDEEFPANANILFDETASDYLPTEDYAFLCGLLVNKLKKLKTT